MNCVLVAEGEGGLPNLDGCGLGASSRMSSSAVFFLDPFVAFPAFDLGGG